MAIGTLEGHSSNSTGIVKIKLYSVLIHHIKARSRVNWSEVPKTGLALKRRVETLRGLLRDLEQTDLGGSRIEITVEGLPCSTRLAECLSFDFAREVFGGDMQLVTIPKGRYLEAARRVLADVRDLKPLRGHLVDLTPDFAYLAYAEVLSTFGIST